MFAGSKTSGDNTDRCPLSELNPHYNYHNPLFYQALAAIQGRLYTSASIAE